MEISLPQTNDSMRIFFYREFSCKLSSHMLLVCIWIPAELVMSSIMECSIKYLKPIQIVYPFLLKQNWKSFVVPSVPRVAPGHEPSFVMCVHQALPDVQSLVELKPCSEIELGITANFSVSVISHTLQKKGEQLFGNKCDFQNHWLARETVACVAREWKAYPKISCNS